MGGGKASLAGRQLGACGAHCCFQHVLTSRAAALLLYRKAREVGALSTALGIGSKYCHVS